VLAAAGIALHAAVGGGLVAWVRRDARETSLGRKELQGA